MAHFVLVLLHPNAYPKTEIKIKQMFTNIILIENMSRCYDLFISECANGWMIRMDRNEGKESSVPTSFTWPPIFIHTPAMPVHHSVPFLSSFYHLVNISTIYIYILKK